MLLLRQSPPSLVPACPEMKTKTSPLPDVYFDNRTGSYWLKINPGKFINLDSRSVKLHFMRAGFRCDEENKDGLKSGDNLLVVAQIERNVDYAGPLAGHKVGSFKTSADNSFLVTQEVRQIVGKEGDCEWIEKFFGQLFGVEQLPYVLCWLKFARESLHHRHFRPGQLLALAGPSECGKSLFQAIVTEFFGGRVAKPYRYMIGETQFNADLAQAEHLMIEDENASNDIRSRRKFGAAIKEFTVNTTMSIHGKGKQAIALPTFKRLTLSVNDEPENLMILPPLDESILDKVMLIKCNRSEIGENRKKTWDRIIKELPAFAFYLDKMPVPKAMQSVRFGVKAYHNPELLEVLASLSPENRLLSVIQEVIFGPGSKDDMFDGTAEELEKQIRASNFSFAAEKLFHFNTACAVYLARLSKKQPSRFSSRKSGQKTVWLITRGKDNESNNKSAV